MGTRASAIALSLGLVACGPAGSSGSPGSSATQVATSPMGASGSRPGGDPGARPVVVELFTSEGCSSCPPADRVLMQLHERGAGGVPVIAIEHHVDYWNELGWEDPFSSAASTARQRGYRRVRGSTTIFTPEAVVDGVHSLNGSDGDGLARRIAERAALKTVAIRVDVQDGRRAAVVLAAAPSQAATLHVAVVEHGLVTEVPHGENAGRTLAHGPVVRWFHDAGPARAGTTTVALGVAATGNRAVVALVQADGVQAEGQGAILGAATSAPR